MMKWPDVKIDNHWVRSRRGSKNSVNPRIPYAFLMEEERGLDGSIEKIATIFLTNKECPFQCLMCDLWKNTTSQSVGVGDIPAQIKWALDRLPRATSIKLYNSGNFFDSKAIPVADYQAIAALVADFDRIIVENHPKLLNSNTFKFQSLISSELEIAIGLETSNPIVLEKLNKGMTLHDFEVAVNNLSQHGISTRAFILLKPPFLDESEGITWAKRSIKYAFQTGVKTAVVIPTRYGNGALNDLGEMGYFSPPNIKSLEQVMDYGVQLNEGNVFVDLWDIEIFSECSKCVEARKNRLSYMNLHQVLRPEVICDC